ncbi:MAG: mechanosensitive ion channel family protein [Candidatus Aminicenantes bacterium]|nr:mechanosensitive ion channel family protein [Candidatus Aminicenantes bacterium]
MKEFTDVFQFIWNNDYLRFLLIAIFSFITAFLIKLIVAKVLKPLAFKTKTKIDDLIIKSISKIIFYFTLFLGMKIGLQHFEFENPILDNIIETILLFIVLLFILKIIDDFSRQWLKEWKATTKTTADERLIPLLQKMLKAMAIILSIFFVLSTWKVNITPLLTTAGIAGIALALAVKDPIVNMLGGLQLVLDKTFKVNDKIELESGEIGIVLDIGLRSTKIKTYDNESIYVPNGYLANAKIKNFTHPDGSIRVNVNFGVEYGSDTEKVRTVVLKAIKEIDMALEVPEPAVQFHNMSDFSLDFVARVWIQDFANAYAMKLEMTDKIYNALNQAHIGIPFPTRTIYTKTAE